MKVSLFVPCFIDASFPDVGVALLELLERVGCDVDFPLQQTCCGHPMGNSGCGKDAVGTEALRVKNSCGCDYIVAPSGSSVHHLRDHMTAIEPTAQSRAVRANTYELVEFLHDVLKVDTFPWAEFPHKVGLPNSCGTLPSFDEILSIRNLCGAKKGQLELTELSTLN